MKAPLFEYPSYQYQIKDWEFKKKGLLKRLKGENFIRTRLQTFETDRQTTIRTTFTIFKNSFVMNSGSLFRKHRLLVV